MPPHRLPAVIAWAAILAAAAAATEHAAATEDRRLADVAAFGNPAVAANGQTAFVIDARRRTIVALEGLGAGDVATRVREVVAAAEADEGGPVAIGCLHGDVVAAVCRDEDQWDVRTFRIRPGHVVDVTAPEAKVPLGAAGGPAPHVGVVVSRSRDWLAITGLPAPLPSVVRCVFAGAAVRLLPEGEPRDGDTRPVAAAVSPADELVLLEAAGDAEARVVFLTPTGRMLLRLDTGLTNVRAAAYGRGDGRLWVVAGRPGRLWRLDAEMQAGEQGIRATPAGQERSADLIGMIDGPGGSLLAIEAGTPSRLVRLDTREGEDE